MGAKTKKSSPPPISFERTYLKIMADIIAKRLITALSTSQPSTAEPSSDASAGSTSSSSQGNGASSSEKVQQLEQWSDELETQLLTTGGRQFHNDPTMTSAVMKEAGNILHASILAEVSSENSNSNWEDDDAAANKATQNAADSLPTGSDGEAKDMDLYLLASLLRAAGLFMRWHFQVLSSPGSTLKSPSDLSSNPMTRLKFKSMLLLYAKILDMEISTNNVTAARYPDVPRFASICIFRATYGEDVLTTTARKLFVNSIDGCSYLMRALLKGDQPVPRLFSIVRNVHHLISASEESIPKMQKSLGSLTATSADEGSDKNGGEDVCETDQKQQSSGLSEALIATLAWAYRSEPPFPGTTPSDRRSDVVLEILRALYALDTSSYSKTSRPSNETMTQIGIILCELLQFSNVDERVYQIKLSVVALLLNAPKDYGGYLVEKGGIPPLVDILSYQTSLVVVERRGSSSEDAAAVVPILLLLLKLVQSNPSALQIVKNEVFPPSAEEAFARKASFEMAKGQSEGTVRAKNMAPLDAPKGTLRWKLIRLMLWIDSNVKRSACELLYALCKEDSTEFVLRTGFGNAVHFLGVRGFVNLPAGVEK